MERWIASSAKNPCCICGRTKDGDCRRRADGQIVFCYRGSTLGPPQGLRKGEVLTDLQGRKWAYTGESRHSDRDGAVFVIHEERAQTQLPGCAPPPPAPAAPATKSGEACTLTTYAYREDLAVARYDFAGQKKKTFQPQHFLNGTWHPGGGAEVWPFYGSIGDNNKDTILEVEGEKCADILRAQGIAAITHPGHQRDEKSCIERYKQLLHSGVKTVYFISDNDAPGRKKAAAFAGYAGVAGLVFHTIRAEEIWPELPVGGSVDDMPAEQLSTLIPAAIRAAAGAAPTPIDRTSYSKLRQALQEFSETGPDSSSEVQAGIADLAAAHGATLYDARRIWDSIEEDSVIAAEALAASASINQRQGLESKRTTFRLEDYLPKAVVQPVEELTDNLACDPLTAISVVLTTVAGVLRTGHRLDAGDGLFVKEPVMWCLISGPSGSGKSPVMRILAKDRLRLVQQHYHILSEEAYEEWIRRCAGTPKKLWPDQPVPLTTCLTDFTTESLNGIIAENHAKGLGTFFYSEEVKEILGNFDEYKSHGKGRGKETFLCLFDGNVNSQHRVGRRSKPIVGKVQNALLGGVQPGVFKGMLQHGDDAGIFGRCLIVPLPTKYCEPNFNRTAAEIKAVHIAEQGLENFYLRCMTLDPTVLRLDQEAVDMFVLLSRDTYDKLQQAPVESHRAVYGKRLGYILQVALTMHLARVAAGEESPDVLHLNKRTLARATVLVDLLQGYATVGQEESQMIEHGHFDLPRRIHGYSEAKDGCTVRVFQRNCIPSRLRKHMRSSSIKAVMDQLVEMGLGRWKDGVNGEIFVAKGKFPD